MAGPCAEVEQDCKPKFAYEQSEKSSTTSYDIAEEDAAAQVYLNHLLKEGASEGDSGADFELPDYYDEQLFLKGQSFMSKYRFVLTSSMLFGLGAVLSIPSILRVLICTRQSSTAATAYRRYVRTILHTNAWYEYAPTEKSSKFWTSLQAVRRAHARSSRACAKQDAGLISQKDLALTQFGFIGFIMLGAPRISLDDSVFMESTTHMWRVLGYLLGIKEEYNICASSWAESKPRFDIVMRKVYAPALEQAGDDFRQMIAALVGGMWPLNPMLTVDTYLFFTKRLAYVKGYEYFDFDFHPKIGYLDAKQHRYFNDLGWWDRFSIAYGLTMVTYLYKYSIFRWYLNFRVWCTDRIIYYLPYLAFWKFGFKWAYVRIFTRSGAGKEFEFHLKDD